MYAIEVENVYKSFKIYHDKGSTLKEKIIFKHRNKYDEFHALKGVSLKIEKGQVVGLIGKNGSGKSTLLKLMTKIIYPDKGEIIMKGKVSSLLELGAGFHPDFSGRENIYVNASIFGLTKSEIDSKIEEIIEFAELGQFIDNPIRTYSSGMYMRLAFSVAINVNPDILLIDEILAVGDANFQKKCFDKLKEFKAKGVTIVIVSHDLGSLDKICDELFWLDDGIIKQSGNARRVIDIYLGNVAKQEEKKIEAKNEKAKKNVKLKEIQKDKVAIDEVNAGEKIKNENNSKEEIVNTENRWGTMEVEISDVKMYTSNNVETYTFKTEDYAVIRIHYKVNKDINNVAFGIEIYKDENLVCYGTNTVIDKIKNININKSGSIDFVMSKFNLMAASYKLSVAVQAEDGRDYDYQKNRISFNVYSDLNDAGIARIEHKWIVN